MPRPKSWTVRMWENWTGHKVSEKINNQFRLNMALAKRRKNTKLRIRFGIGFSPPRIQVKRVTHPVTAGTAWRFRQAKNYPRIELNILNWFFFFYFLCFSKMSCNVNRIISQSVALMPIFLLLWPDFNRTLLTNIVIVIVIVVVLFAMFFKP